MKPSVPDKRRRTRRLEWILGASFLLLFTGITLALTFAGMARTL